jgi:hypothetical protein
MPFRPKYPAHIISYLTSLASLDEKVRIFKLILMSVNIFQRLEAKIR